MGRQYVSGQAQAQAFSGPASMWIVLPGCAFISGCQSSWKTRLYLCRGGSLSSLEDCEPSPWQSQVTTLGPRLGRYQAWIFPAPSSHHQWTLAFLLLTTCGAMWPYQVGLCPGKCGPWPALPAWGKDLELGSQGGLAADPTWLQNSQNLMMTSLRGDGRPKHLRREPTETQGDNKLCLCCCGPTCSCGQGGAGGR